MAAALAVPSAVARPRALRAPATPPPNAKLLTWGIGDQGLGIFGDPRWRALPLRHMRYFLPWDLIHERHYLRLANQWVGFALRNHAIPLIAITQSEQPHMTRYLPSLRQYRRDVGWIIHHFRGVREWTPWNEANLLDQSTLQHPAVAADYWRTMLSICHRCTVTSPSLVGYRVAPRSWLPRFLRAARGLHGPWALHLYNDVNEFTTRTLKTFERKLKGPIWVTEVAGWRHFRGFPASARRQTRALEYLFAIAPLNFPRVQRWYLYQWVGSTRKAVWDSGLLNLNGSARPALRVIQHYLLPTDPPLPKL